MGQIRRWVIVSTRWLLGGRMKADLTFREELKALLTFLTEQHGFALISETLAVTKGGDCSVTLESSEFRLRFVRDKAHLFADVGDVDGRGEWYDLNTALEYLNGVRPVAGSFDATGLQLALKSNFDAVRALFGASGVARRANSLGRFTAMSAVERWGRLQDTCFE